MSAPSTVETDCLAFFRALFGDSSGYLALFSGRREYAALSEPQQVFFLWPGEAEQAAGWVRDHAAAGREVYYCAHLLTQKKRRKEHAAPLRALYADLDHDKTTAPGIPEPSIVIETSPARYQAHWLLSRAVEPAAGEALNRRLAVALGADKSGYDLSQLLRVPGTRNRKYSDAPPVRIVRMSEVRLDPDELEQVLPVLPLPVEARPIPQDRHDGQIEPPVRLDASGLAVWRGECPARKPDDAVDRSESLYKIAAVLWEAGASPSAIVAALEERDRVLRFGKYLDRPEEYQRIVEKVRADHAAADGDAQHDPEMPGPFVPPGWIVTPYATPISPNALPELRKEYPSGFLPGSRLLWDFCTLAAQAAPGMPDDWAVMALLSGVSILIPQLHVENLGLNVWLLGIGAQSVGKGLLFDGLTRVITAAAQALNRPMELFTSGTPEGLLLAAAQGPVLVSFEEAGAFFERVEKLDHQTGFKQVLCGLYDGRAVSHRLKKHGESVRIPQPHVVLVAAINRQDFARVVKPRDITSGFLSRMLMVAPDLTVRPPERVPDASTYEALGQRLGEHLAQFEDVRWVTLGEWPKKPAHVIVNTEEGEGGGEVVTGRALLTAFLHGNFRLPSAGQQINLDEPIDGEPAPPVGREIARIKKIAVLMELLDAQPRVEVFTEKDKLPPEAQIGDRYLSISDGNIVRAVGIVLRSRAYAIRALRWIGESEDEILADKIVQALSRNSSLSTSDLMKATHARGVVYLNRVLDALKHSGKIECHRGKSGKGFRWRLAPARL